MDDDVVKRLAVLKRDRRRKQRSRTIFPADNHIKTDCTLLISAGRQIFILRRRDADGELVQVFVMNNIVARVRVAVYINTAV